MAAITAGTALAVVGVFGLGHVGLLRSELFLSWSLLVGLGAGLLPAKRPQGGQDPPAPGGGTTWAWVERILLLATAGALGFGIAATVADAFYRAPGSCAYDDLAHHLTAIATWNRYHDLRMVKFSVGDVSTSFYPIVGEIVAWIFLVPFRDSDVAARWSELFFALSSLIGLAAVGRRIGLSPRSCAFVVLVYCTIPRVFPFPALAAGNDHATAFFTLAALDGILALILSSNRGNAAYAGLGLGLLVGTKYIGILYAAVALAALAFSWLVRRPKRGELAATVPLLAATMLIVGGYTYLRNAVTTANPVFPAPVSLLGREILPGWEPTSLASRSRLPEYRIDVVAFLTARPDLFGLLAPWTLLPAALVAPIVAAGLALRRRDGLATALVLAMPAVFFLLFRYFMHDHRDIRYFMAGVGLAALALAWLLERLPSRAGGALRVSLALASVSQSLVQLRTPTTGSLLAAVVLACGGATAWYFSGRDPQWEWRRRLHWAWPAAAVLLAGSATRLGPAIEGYTAVRLAAWPAAGALERLTSARGTAIAFAGGNQPYPFFGSALQNEVHFVPRTRFLSDEFYDWGGTSRFPFPRGAYEPWRRNLSRLRIGYLVIRHLDAQGPEHRWALRHPEAFERVYEDKDATIWRVSQEGAQGREMAEPAL